jgi:hypothetical protein
MVVPGKTVLQPRGIFFEVICTGYGDVSNLSLPGLSAALRHRICAELFTSRADYGNAQ